MADALPRVLLDHLHTAFVARGDKRNRVPVAPSTSRPSDAMHIFSGHRNVKVNHMGNLFNIYPTRHDIGCHQDFEVALFETLDDALAFVLCQVAVDGNRAIASFTEGFCQLCRASAGLGENHRVLQVFHF